MRENPYTNLDDLNEIDLREYQDGMQCNDFRDRRTIFTVI